MFRGSPGCRFSADPRAVERASRNAHPRLGRKTYVVEQTYGMIAAPELPDGLGMDDLTAEKRDSTPVASAARKWLVFRGLRRQEMAGRNQIQSARCYACVRWPPSLPAPQ